MRPHPGSCWTYRLLPALLSPLLFGCNQEMRQSIADNSGQPQINAGNHDREFRACIADLRNRSVEDDVDHDVAVGEHRFYYLAVEEGAAYGPVGIRECYASSVGFEPRKGPFSRYDLNWPARYDLQSECKWYTTAYMGRYNQQLSKKYPEIAKSNCRGKAPQFELFFGISEADDLVRRMRKEYGP